MKKSLVLPPPQGTVDMAPAIDIMRRMRAAGHTFASVATYLNENGFKTKRGKRFSPATIQQILSGWISVPA